MNNYRPECYNIPSFHKGFNSFKYFKDNIIHGLKRGFNLDNNSSY